MGCCGIANIFLSSPIIYTYCVDVTSTELCELVFLLFKDFITPSACKLVSWPIGFRIHMLSFLACGAKHINTFNSSSTYSFVSCIQSYFEIHINCLQPTSIPYPYDPSGDAKGSLGCEGWPPSSSLPFFHIPTHHKWRTAPLTSCLLVCHTSATYIYIQHVYIPYAYIPHVYIPHVPRKPHFCHVYHSTAQLCHFSCVCYFCILQHHTVGHQNRTP